MTALRLKKIEEIREGDLVLAYDEKTGEQAYKPVVQLFRNTTEAWYHVRVNGEEIVCTGGHPFYVLNADNSRNILEFEGVKSKGTGKWICARDLKKSDKVLLSDGSCGIIETIEVETLSAPETTYNFEVADFHTYYVSDNKVLVHNKCPVTELQMSRQEAIKYAKEFLGDDFVKVKPGVYQSADGLRRMRFDLTHHPFRGKFYSGNHSPIHINLYVWKVPIKRGSSCFMAGTLVLTAAGLKKIEEIREGDLVLAYDEETGEQAYKPVTRLFRNTTEAWYHVRVNDEEIICTGGHPFYILNADNNRNILEFEGVKSKGTGKWICARDLKISDQVLLSDGSCAIIEAIQVEKLSAPETTYNFEVADYHTYYVSDSKVLVHNECPVGSKLPNEGEPNSIAIRYDTKGNVYSVKLYGSNGKAVLRIDMQGRAHTCSDIGVPQIPHVHIYKWSTGNGKWSADDSMTITLGKFFDIFKKIKK